MQFEDRQLQYRLNETVRERDQQIYRNEKLKTQIFEYEARLTEQERFIKAQLYQIATVRTDLPEYQAQLILKENEILKLSYKLRQAQTQLEIVKAERPRVSDAFRHSYCEESSQYMSKTDMDDTPGPADLDALRLLQGEKSRLEEALYAAYQLIYKLEGKIAELEQQNQLLTIYNYYVNKTNTEISQVLLALDGEMKDKSEQERYLRKITEDFNNLQKNHTVYQAYILQLTEKGRTTDAALQKLKDTADKKQTYYYALEQGYFELDKEYYELRKRAKEDKATVDSQKLEIDKLKRYLECSVVETQLLKQQNYDCLQTIQQEIKSAYNRQPQTAELQETDTAKYYLMIQELKLQIEQKDATLREFMQHVAYHSKDSTPSPNYEQSSQELHYIIYEQFVYIQQLSNEISKFYNGVQPYFSAYFDISFILNSIEQIGALAVEFEAASMRKCAHIYSRMDVVAAAVEKRQEDTEYLRQDNIHLAKSITAFMTDNETQVSAIAQQVSHVFEALHKLSASLNATEVYSQLHRASISEPVTTSLDDVKYHLQQIQQVVQQMTVMSSVESHYQGYDDLLTSALALTAQRNDLRQEADRLKAELENCRRELLALYISQYVGISKYFYLQTDDTTYYAQSSEEGSAHIQYATLSVQTEMYSAIKLENHDENVQTNIVAANTVLFGEYDRKRYVRLAEELFAFSYYLGSAFCDESISKLARRLYYLELSYQPLKAKLSTVNQQLIALISAQIDRNLLAVQPRDTPYNEILEQQKQANHKLSYLYRQLYDYVNYKGGQEMDLSLCMSQLYEIQEDKDSIAYKLNVYLRDKIAENYQLAAAYLDAQARVKQLEVELSEAQQLYYQQNVQILNLKNQISNVEQLSSAEQHLRHQLSQLQTEHEYTCKQLKEANAYAQMYAENLLQLYYERDKLVYDITVARTEFYNGYKAYEYLQIELNQHKLALVVANQAEYYLKEFSGALYQYMADLLQYQQQNGKYARDLYELKAQNSSIYQSLAEKQYQLLACYYEREYAADSAINAYNYLLQAENKIAQLNEAKLQTEQLLANVYLELHKSYLNSNALYQNIAELKENMQTKQAEYAAIQTYLLNAGTMEYEVGRQSKYNADLNLKVYLFERYLANAQKERSDAIYALENAQKQGEYFDNEINALKYEKQSAESELAELRAKYAMVYRTAYLYAESHKGLREYLAEQFNAMHNLSTSMLDYIESKRRNVEYQLQGVVQSVSLTIAGLQYYSLGAVEMRATIKQLTEQCEILERQNQELQELYTRRGADNISSQPPLYVDVSTSILDIYKVQNCVLEKVSVAQSDLQTFAYQILQRLTDDTSNKTARLADIQKSITDHHNALLALYSLVERNAQASDSYPQIGRYDEILAAIAANTEHFSSLKQLIVEDMRMYNSKSEELTRAIANLESHQSQDGDVAVGANLAVQIETKFAYYFYSTHELQREQLSHLRTLVDGMQKYRASTGSATPQSLHGNSLSLNSPAAHPYPLYYDYLGVSAPQTAPNITYPGIPACTTNFYAYASYATYDSLEIGRLNMRIAYLESELGRVRDIKIANCAIQSEEYLKRENARLEADLKQTITEYDLLKKQIIDMKTQLSAAELTISEQSQKIAVLRESYLKFENLSKQKDLQDEQLQNLRAAFGEIRALVQAHFGDNSDIISQIEQLLTAKRQIIEKEKQALELESQLKAANEERKQFRRRAREERDQKERIYRLNKQMELKIERYAYQLEKYREDVREIRQYAQEYASAVQEELKSRVL